MVFSEDELDIIKESLNIGLGESALALSEILNDFIQIDVPDITIELWSKAKDILKSKFDNHVSVYQDFLGDLQGKSYVLYPNDSLDSLLSILIDEENIDDNMQNDILMEVSNILINSLIGSIGNLLNEDIRCSLPEIEIKDFDELVNKEDYFLVIIDTNLRFKKKSIDINILIIFSINSFDKFRNNLLPIMENDENK